MASESSAHPVSQQALAEASLRKGGVGYLQPIHTHTHFGGNIHAEREETRQ